MATATTEPQADSRLAGPTGTALIEALLAQNTGARAAINDRVTRYVAYLIESFTAWYDDMAVRRLATEIARTVQAGQTTIAQDADVYLAWVASEQSHRPVRPVGTIDVDQLRRGVDDLTTVYERLGEQFRYSRSTGDDPVKALKKTLDRADAMVLTDVALAARSQAAKTMQDAPAVIGYRRILRPELSEGGVCGLCIAASDRLYKKRDLLPLHDRCKCGILTVTKGSDPGSRINNDDLAQVYADAQGTGTATLKRVRYKIGEHGELGPTLVPKKTYGGKYKQPKNKSGNPAVTAESLRESLTADRMLKSLMALPPAKSPEAQKYRDEQIARYRKELGLD